MSRSWAPFSQKSEPTFLRRRIQQRKYGREVGAALCNPNLVHLAGAFGAHGQRVETPAQLYQALCAAWGREGPTLIEVPLEADVGFA